MSKLTLRRSRKSFIAGYVFFLLFGLILYSFYILDIFSGFVLYLLSFPVVYLFFLPEYWIVNNRYLIKEDTVEEVTGVITRKKTIVPWGLVSNVSMKKGIFGRMFDYG